MFGREYKSFLVDDEKFSLAYLYMDAKFLTKSKILLIWETLKVSVKAPWNVKDSIVLQNNKQMLDMFKLFEQRRIGKIHVYIKVMPLAMEILDEIPLL